MDRTIINFEVPKKTADDVEEFLLSTRTDWLYHTETVFKNSQQDYQSRFNFTNKIADFNIVEKYWFHKPVLKIDHKNSKEIREDYILGILKPLQDYIAIEVIKKPVSLKRIFINMFLHSSDENAIAHPHLDSEFENILSCIYYVNDTSGDTVLFNDDKSVLKRISPKKGTGVLFDANILHAGCFPKDENKPRIIINFIFVYI